MNSDIKLGLTLGAYILAIYIGGSLASVNKLAGAIICIGATAALLIAFYISGRHEEEEKRLRRYKDYANERLREVEGEHER